MMEWNQQEEEIEEQQINGNIVTGNYSNDNNGINGGMIYAKIMTDEQIEILRKQIAVFSTISDQLIQMHRTLSSQQDFNGMRLGNTYFDPFSPSSGHKFNSRQRWTPSPMQLQILEQIFDQGNGTPTKQKIKEITTELIQHGPLSETNVYNWFQNRRARSKRKQTAVAPTTNVPESEANTEAGSPQEKKARVGEFQTEQNPGSQTDDLCFQNFDLSSLEAHGGNKSLGQLSFYEDVMHSPSMYTL